MNPEVNILLRSILLTMFIFSCIVFICLSLFSELVAALVIVGSSYIISVAVAVFYMWPKLTKGE